MRTNTMILPAVALLLGICAYAAEKKIAVQKLPPAVQQTVKEQSKDATIVGVTKETEKGKTVYELETKKANGQTRDLMIDAAGAVLSVEEEVALDSIPAPARAALEKAAAGAKIVRVESVTEGKQVSYEAEIDKKGKKSSVTAKADGTLAKE
jgi:uncharacterized membrane protein YkoI